MKGKERRRKLRWTLGAKLGIAFGSVVCMVMVVAAIASYEISGLTGSSAGLARASIPAVDRCLKLELEIRNALSTYRGYMVFGDDSFRIGREEASERIDEHLAEQETSQAVERMNHGTTHVETGVGLATEAGSSLEEIVESATSVRSMIATIAEAARQQSEAAACVSRRVESINTESSQTVAATEQSAAAASQLAAKAEHLSGLVSAFKL
ncbi:MAG: hypothetical protein AAGI53_01010 [Planctomycetota bacterium]